MLTSQIIENYYFNEIKHKERILKEDASFIYIDKINTSDIDIFFHSNFANSDEKNLHSHDYFELIYVYKGTGKHYFPHESFRLKQGDIFLLNTHVKHAISLDNEDDILINILIRPSYLKSTLLSMLNENKIISDFFINSLYLLTTKEEYLYFQSSQSSHTEHLIQSLIEECIKKEDYYRTCVTSYLLLIFSEIMRSHQVQSHVLSTTNKILNRIILYISNHPCTTLEELSKEMNYSRSYISQLFKKHLNINFSTFLYHIKIEKAALLLKQSDLKIEDIAYELGFYDQSHFYKKFKQTYGMTPRQYRKRNHL